MARLELFKYSSKITVAMVEQRFSKIIIILALSLLAVVILITAAGVFLFQNKEQVFLASVFNNKETYDELFGKLSKPLENANAKAGIISHHFLAKELIANFYNKISSDKIQTVFLIAPDHYNNYLNPESIAYTSNLNWSTPFGELKTDGNLIKNLQKNENIETKDSAIGLEHGIYVEIPFIKKFFPNAKIVPLVLKNNLSGADFASLGERIRKIGGENSILIVSSDFSHNTPASQALENDKKSINALENLSANKFDQATNDCKQCLAVLSGFLKNDDTNFYFFGNTNSFNISGQDENSVTSYVSGYYTKKDFLQILFAGDLMFDRGIRYYANQNGGNDFIFDKILSELNENDLVVVNLEGPITSNKSISSGTVPGSTNNYFFTFDPSVAKTLFDKNIRLVDLGNNHITNFETAGIKSTQTYLSNANVDYFGAPGSNLSVIKNIGGVKIGFVSYNQFAGENPENIVAEIAKIKTQSDVTIVFSHWGIEYKLTEADFQKDLAHKFINAGADLIIGSHPHVIQPMEEYNGKRIYYSLGNFIFDQYFDENVRNGLGVVVKINKTTKQLEFSEKHFYLGPNGQTIEKP
ncbi:MAG: AmmeMemoRadiSam system protein B [Candidatus Staskawiczbacteria bacterium]|nr:AmmeMemoRadiSam system protein B [Candidatus Staskawiczbacteria bacterium]